MLKDARGYRSPYINALNGAVAAARVVGGDVTPEETPSGTLLTLAQTRRSDRFELFCGYDDGESGADALCLSDGTLYVAAVAQELKPGRDVSRRDGDLQPRANGWCTRKTIANGDTLTFACVRYKGAYYLIAKKDGESVSKLLPEALGKIDPAQIEELFTFGQFYWAGETGDKSIQISQDVHGDVWYGGAAQEETPYAWRVRAVTLPEPEPETPKEGVEEGGTETPNEPPPEEQSSGFQVFAPFAVISQATLPTVPDGFESTATWQDIPKDVITESSSGTWTLYAILKYTPGVPASGSGSSATPAQPAKTEFFLSSTLPDTSSDPAGTQYRLFHIASRSADGTLTQIQAGPIIETFPSASGGGLCAGPLTYYKGHIVQYLGSFGAGGAFTQAKNASGQPIIVADYGAAIDILKRNSDGNEVRTSVGFLPLNAPSTSDLVMSKRTVSGLTLGLTYVAPHYEDDVGGLKATTGVSVTFWGDEPTPGSETTILQTITESANYKTIYEDSSSQSGEQA